MAMKRTYGAEQPYIPAGIFKIRVPFIHYRWEWPEFFQALLMCSTCLGAIPVLQQVLGVSFEIAWSMVIINGFLYCLHVLLGDPVVPGWITPAIPLVVAFLGKYQLGVVRYQELIALQLIVGVIFLLMGVTGAAGKLMKVVPNSIKAGVLLGAGTAAIIGEFNTGGRFSKYPVSITAGCLIAFFCLFSSQFMKMRANNRFWNTIGKVGMLPAIIIAVFLAPMAGELPWFHIEIGTFFKVADFAGIWNTLSPFSIGFPAVSMFLSALPLAIVVYIIAFGDFITSEALIHEADEVRKDEKIDFNANRSNLISAIRNIVMALICPYTQLCGPLWAAVTASVAQRYKEGPEAMESIHSGAGTFRWSTFLGVSCIPIVSLLQPVLPVALSLTLLVQGYICTRLAMDMCETDTDRGIAGCMGAVLAIQGAAWGLAVGVLLYFALKSYSKKKDADPIPEAAEIK
ncbi:hypothetical protein EQM14_06620 [Caproiciproducens sp. NJN-50]|uniref:benzoate/H(+) symporter BenE family transporter n=1 Tax=Acutalibacteraceae TaxID=3082771 RepID=UPI000FFDFB03|nr:MULTISPECIES: benzoate/H(+) symporter BenE family transporter [Acutalibacteraceae]QAT49475.1 hypothetical protein EQM14_06620 [Caproiciproducens sp. NJN-50]